MKRIIKKFVTTVLLSSIIVVSVVQQNRERVYAEEAEELGDDVTDYYKSLDAEQRAEIEALLKNEAGRYIDPEEFTTREQWDAYYAKYGGGSTATPAADQYLALEYTPRLKYTITDLPYKNVMQSFYYDAGDSAVYVSQSIRGVDNTPSQIKDDVSISYCKVSGNTARYQSKMIILDAGHGTTIVPYTHDGKKYLLVCAKSKEVSTDHYCTVQIGRVPYQAGAVINASSIERFCNFNYATKDGSNFGTLRHVVANISTDGATIYFRIQNMSKRVLTIAYSFSTFNTQLDNADSKLVSFLNNSTMRNAVKFSYEQASTDLVYIYNYCQGTDINNNIVYVAAGDDAAGETFTMMSFSQTGKCINHYLIYPDKSSINKINLELEGIQIIDSSTMCIGASPCEDKLKTTAYIFAITNYY